ncbi:MAG: glycosyltransferase [Nitrospiraceae bacterium]|nr:MAG: glycosyltransferase [Nitrospiraceae bacterium]
MNILFCCEFYAPSVGGVQEVMRQLAERLVVRGHSVTVATTAIPIRGFKELNGVQIQEFSISGNFANGMKGDLDSYRHFVTHTPFDVVMIKAAQQWTFDALWPVLSRIPGRKVFIPCGFSCLYEPDYGNYFRELPSILRQFDHLIFYASEYRDIHFARQHGLSDFSIIPNGASEVEFGITPDPSFRRRYGLCDEDLLFLTVGSPARMKGHREIADAFLRADFSGRPATLLLNSGTSPARQTSSVVPSIGVKSREYWRVAREIGGTDGVMSMTMHLGHGVLNKMGIRVGRYARIYEEPRKVVRDDLLDLIDKIHNHHSCKRVVLTDLPRADLVQAYVNTDLFVFASHVEYSPLVLFESAAGGTPFLSVPVGNAAEIAEWTGGGVICPASQDERGYTKVDPSVFSDHWSRLANDRAYLRQLGRVGKQNWAARFTWERITVQYENVFRKVATYARA